MQKENSANNKLYNIEDLKGLVTCVTLSKEPFVRKDIGNLDYINYNSVFETEVGFKKAIDSSIRLVNTEYVFYCDYDDDFPEQLILPDKALVYGDFIYTNKNGTWTSKSYDWSFKTNIDKYWIIHKPVFRTAEAIKVLNHLEDIDLHFHFLFYFMLSYCYGADYNDKLIAGWNKGETGQHIYARKLKDKTVAWLMENAPALREKILSAN